MTGTSSETQKQVLAEGLWLTYFNDYLYDHGVITEQERNGMIARIVSRNAQKKQQG